MEEIFFNSEADWTHIFKNTDLYPGLPKPVGAMVFGWSQSRSKNPGSSKKPWLRPAPALTTLNFLLNA